MLTSKEELLQAQLADLKPQPPLSTQKERLLQKIRTQQAKVARIKNQCSKMQTELEQMRQSYQVAREKMDALRAQFQNLDPGLEEPPSDFSQDWGMEDAMSAGDEPDGAAQRFFIGRPNKPFARRASGSDNESFKQAKHHPGATPKSRAED